MSVVMDVPERDELSSRHCPPAHYVVKINPVEELLKLEEHKFGPFEVGGYDWSLELRPRHKTREGKKYMSLYLVIDPKKLKSGEKIRVDYKFFMLNHNNNTYVIFKERGKELGAFSNVNTRRGLEKFLSWESFKEPQYGYVDRESCTIGAELLVSKPTRKEATLTIIPSTIEKKLKIERFSTSKSSSQYSEKFDLGGKDWKLKVHKHEESLSVHLEAQSISSGTLRFVKARLRVVNKEDEVSGWLHANEKTFGKRSFMPWSNLEQLKEKKEKKEKIELPFAVKILTMFDVRKANAPVL